MNKSLELTNNLNLSLKNENEIFKGKLNEYEKTNSKFYKENTLKETVIKELRQTITDLNSELNKLKSSNLVETDQFNEINQKIKKQEAEINELSRKLTDSNDLIKSLKEENFQTKFSSEKIKDENESMISIFNLIKKDLDSFLSSLLACEFSQEMQKYNNEINTNEKKLENQVVCKIKIIKNISENLTNKNDLITKENEILKSELERNNNLLDIKQKEIEMLTQQNKNLEKNSNDLSLKANELNKIKEKLEKELNDKSNEIQKLIKAQTGSNSEKVEKLTKLLDESNKANDIKNNELKNEYELKIKNLEEEREKLINQNIEQINKIKEQSNTTIQHVKTEASVPENLKTKMIELINNSKFYFKKFNIEDYPNNQQDLNDKDCNNCLASLSKLIDRYVLVLNIFVFINFANILIKFIYFN